MPGQPKAKDTKPAGKVRKPAGRPVGSKNKPKLGEMSNAERIEYDSKKKAEIVERQRDDCERIATAIKTASATSNDPDSAGKLARATQILHSLERDAHDFGNKGQDTNAVLIIPLPADTMEKWNILSAAIIPQAPAPPTGIQVVNSNVSFEEEVIGEPAEDEPAPDPAGAIGPQGAGGASS